MSTKKQRRSSGLNGRYEPPASIIVPVLNAEETIRDLLDSLMKLDYDGRKLEIIIVDGGSTDKTQEIAKSYPVRLIVEKRRGLNIARNTGVKNSNGEIILFTDSDCVVPEDWVKKIVRNFRDESVGCVGGTVERYQDDFLSRYADESIMPVLRNFKEHKVLKDVEPPMDYPAGCNMAFRREVFEKVGGFDEEIRYGFDEDELIERACKAGYKMILDPEAVVKHKHRSNLISLLRRTFTYGRGGTLLIKKKGLGNRLARWNMIVLAGFAAWLSACFLLGFSSAVYSIAYLIPLSLLLLLPFTALVGFYAWKRLGRRRLPDAIVYACLDLLRFFAYVSGEIAGLL